MGRQAAGAVDAGGNLQLQIATGLRVAAGQLAAAAVAAVAAGDAAARLRAASEQIVVVAVAQ